MWFLLGSVLLLSCFCDAKTIAGYTIENEIRIPPNDVSPLKYHVNLTINSDLSASPFLKGSVGIELLVIRQINNFTINVKNLDILELKFLGSKQKHDTHYHNINDDTIFIEFNVYIPSGIYALVIHYEKQRPDHERSTLARSKDAVQGITLAQFKGRSYVVTHGSESGARMYVPCFDEPEMKALWQISIIHSQTLTALSNAGELERRTLENQMAETRFKETPPMASYLLTFALFESNGWRSEQRRTNGTLVTLYVPEELADHLTTYVDLAASELSRYNGLFGLSMLEKLDFFVSPWMDFAMENWGITLGGLPLLTPRAISHELTHLWFGNLVTCRTWEHYWLNEGFATFFQFPTEMLPKVYAYYLQKTNLVKMHSLVQLNGMPTMTARYYMGATFLSMVNEMMGETNFVNAVNFYISQFKYGTVETNDFFTTAAHFVKEQYGDEIDFVEFGRQWTMQSGFPVVNVTRNEDGSFELQQSDVNGNNGSWIIPIAEQVIVGNRTKMVRRFMKPDEDSTQISSTTEFINTGYGMYYTNYGSDRFMELWTKYKGEIDQQITEEKVDPKFTRFLADVCNLGYIEGATLVEAKEYYQRIVNIARQNYAEKLIAID